MNVYPQKSQHQDGRRNNLLSSVLKMFSTDAKIAASDINEQNEIQDIIEGVKYAREEWVNANRCFEYADEEEMVDYYTYKIKACEVRYEYYIKKAKEKGICEL